MSNLWFPSSPAGQPVRSLGSDSVSHRCSDSDSDWRTGSQDAVLQRSHVEALHRSVIQQLCKTSFIRSPVKGDCYFPVGPRHSQCSLSPQRTRPGWLRRLWRRVRPLRPGLATQPSTTPTRSGSSCSEALKTRNGSTTFTSWTHRAGSGPWWR